LGTSDYTLNGTITYWADNQIQTVLDRHKLTVVREELQPIESYNAGTLVYKEYRSQYGNFEETTGGTSIFEIENAEGITYGTANWTADYVNGIITFAADTAGTAYFVNGYSYDINAAAADIWRMKAGHHSSGVDFTTDNMTVKRGQLIKNDQDMANYYAGRGRVKHISFERDDTA
jgi:hypothetical protein